MNMDLRNEKKGLLWLLDEESIFPGSTVQTFLKRLCERQGNTRGFFSLGDPLG